ncbi:MAG: yrvN [Anaerocolumna sp.]|nr:yrvN [Anaerocolumna sp.]
MLLTDFKIFYTIKESNISLVFKEGDFMDLFEYMRNNTMEKESPLAGRLRPTSLEEVVGQSHIIGKDKLLYRAIKADKISGKR